MVSIQWPMRTHPGRLVEAILSLMCGKGELFQYSNGQGILGWPLGPQFSTDAGQVVVTLDAVPGEQVELRTGFLQGQYAGIGYPTLTNWCCWYSGQQWYPISPAPAGTVDPISTTWWLSVKEACQYATNSPWDHTSIIASFPLGPLELRQTYIVIWPQDDTLFAIDPSGWLAAGPKRPIAVFTLQLAEIGSNRYSWETPPALNEEIGLMSVGPHGLLQMETMTGALRSRAAAGMNAITTLAGKPIASIKTLVPIDLDLPDFDGTGRTATERLGQAICQSVGDITLTTREEDKIHGGASGSFLVG